MSKLIVCTGFIIISIIVLCFRKRLERWLYSEVTESKAQKNPSAVKTTTPKSSRLPLEEKIERLYLCNPDLSLMAGRMLSQIEKIDKITQCFDDLMAQNNRHVLIEIQSVLNQTREGILQNINDVLIYCKTAGCDFGNITRADLNWTAVNAELEDNDRKLDKAKRLLDEVAKMLTQHNDDCSDLQLDAWISVIQRQNNQDFSKNSGK